MLEIDVATRGVIKLFLFPPGGLLLLLLFGWLLGRKVLGRLMVLLGILLFYGLATPAGLDWLAARLETVPAPGIAELKPGEADAILVFMADVREGNPELSGADALGPISLERIDHALLLHRTTGLPIVLSGGSVKGDTQPLARLGAAWLDQRAKVPVLALDDSSRDTWENARNSAEILDARGLRRVILVTHAYHMPRALFSSRAAGISAIPAPFAFEHKPQALRKPAVWTDWMPTPGVLVRSYRVLHEMAGLAWYGFSYR